MFSLKPGWFHLVKKKKKIKKDLCIKSIYIEWLKYILQCKFDL